MPIDGWASIFTDTEVHDGTQETNIINSIEVMAWCHFGYKPLP